MRIGIDARLAGSAHAGIGRYIEELLWHLVAIPTDHHWVVFLEKKDQLPWLKDFPKVKQVIAPVRHYTLREQVCMPFFFNREKLDLLHVPHFNVPILYWKKYIVTIHDLLWHERKDARATTLSPFMYRLKYWAYKHVAEFAIRRAAHICVPTEHVRKIVAKYRADRGVRISVTYEGIASAYQHYTVNKKPKSIAPFSFPYLIYVGSLYPHKNVELVLKVLKNMPELHLVIVSGRSVFYEQMQKKVKERALQDRVHFMGYLSDEKTAEAVAYAQALIQPSFSEGFGLSGVEAMAVGTPVLASDIPVFHEVYQDAAGFFDPHHEESFKEAIQMLLAKPQLRISRITRGKVVARQYDWKKTAQETLNVYEQT